MKKLYLLSLLLLAINVARAQDFVLKAVSDHFSISQNGQGINIYGNDIKDNLGNYFLKVNGSHNSLAWSSITGTPTTLAGYGITDASIYTASNGITKTGNNFTLGGTLASTANIDASTNLFNITGHGPDATWRFIGFQNSFALNSAANSNSSVNSDFELTPNQWSVTSTDASGNMGNSTGSTGSFNFGVVNGGNNAAFSYSLPLSGYPLGINGSGYFLVKDEISAAGMEYAGDYSAANASNPRWIIDKGYADAHYAASSGATYTSTNGISLIGTNSLGLGGNLTQNTNINLGAKNLTFTYTDPDLSGVNQVDWGAGWFEAVYNSPLYGGSNLLTSWGQAEMAASGGGAYSNNSSIIAVSVDGTGKPLFNLGGQVYANNAYTFQQISTGIIDPSHSAVSINKGFIISDSIDGIGMQYNNDYSALGKTSDRWIPDWGAVKSYVGGQTGAGATYTASNGITLAGSNFVLDTAWLKTNAGVAADTKVVHLAGAETITGTKTFGTDQVFRTLTLGYGAGNIATNMILGTGFNASTTGTYNLAIGNNVMTTLTTGYWNLGMMNNALKYLTTGTNNQGVGINSLENTTTGGDNIGFGRRTFQTNSTGNGNVGIGSLAGYASAAGNSFNVMIGSYAGYTGSYGSGNIFIGTYAGNGYSGSNQFVLANGDLTNTNPTPLLSGNFSTGQLTLPTAPTTSAGGYTILTRNTSTGAIETISGGSGGASTVAHGDLTAQTSAGTITSVTSAASTSTYDVGGYINVTSVSGDVIQARITYTDENNVSQTLSLSPISAAGNNSIGLQTIRVKGGTTITLQTNLVNGSGSITYDAGGYIRQDY